MKTSKKLLAVLLALAMVLALGVSAYAEGEEGDAETPAEETPATYTITVKNPVGSYEAYQIFAGDLYIAEDGTVTLSNITWGTGITDAGKEALGDAVAYAKTITDANALAEELQAKGYLSTTTEGTYADGEITGLAAGYYLVKNVAGSVTGDNVYTDFIVEVVKDVEVTPKGEKPSVEKKVQDTNDSTGVTSGWQDSADADIGDKVPYQITGTLPTNYADYAEYKYIFHDTLSAGLTYGNDAKVYVNSAEAANEITSEFTITCTGNELTISCANLKAEDNKALEATDKIIVVYTATLNENAAIGALGNPNEVYLEYSNNPTNDGSGTTGETPKDKVIVFTYQLVADKVNEAGTALKGAGFTLYKKGADGAYAAVGEEVKGEEMTTFIWNGIDDGDYKLVETTTPAGYNTMDDQYFTVSAEHDTEAADPQLTEVKGTAAAGSNITLTTASLTLDKGTEDTADDAESANAKLTTEIVNQAGSVLPSTGGIGTTLFYVFGGLMVVAAGVVLVVRRRVSE